jgi:transcriptional regulator with XRE-family HTH domain
MAKMYRPDDVLLVVGRRLRATRVALSLTQEQLAAEIGVSRTALANWELGSALPDVLAMGRLSDRYGATLDWIYRGDMSGLRLSLANRLQGPSLGSSSLGAA